MLGVLPRLVDNQEIKPYVVRFNRWLYNAATRMETMFKRVRFLPVHLKFLDSDGPKISYYNTDQLTLNVAGAVLLKEEIFRLAGFVQNT